MEIFGEKEPAEYVYQVKKGAVRTYKLLSDGRRQIGAFHLQGDLFGLTSGEFHRFTAEAIVKTTLRLLKRKSIETATGGDRTLARDVLRMTTRSLRHAEDHVLLLGRKTSLEKVAAFLVEMVQRISSSETMTLPMTRQDIADNLGLTVETVSRALSKFRRDGAVNSEQFESRNRDTTARASAVAGRTSLWPIAHLSPCPIQIPFATRHNGFGRCASTMTNRTALHLAQNDTAVGAARTREAAPERINGSLASQSLQQLA